MSRDNYGVYGSPTKIKMSHIKNIYPSSLIDDANSDQMTTITSESTPPIKFRDKPRLSDLRKYSVIDPESIGKSFNEDEPNLQWRVISSILAALSFMLVIITLPISLTICIKIISEYERAIVFRLGRILNSGTKGPGLIFVLPCIDSIQRADLRTVTFDVPPQEVLSRDSVTVAVDAVVYYRIYNPVVSITNVKDCDLSTRLLAATTLRNVLGTKDLAEILSDRENISFKMQSMLDDTTHSWGVKVERVEIKDVRLPIQLQRAMAAEAEAVREAKAKLIAAEGEKNSSIALKKASDTLTLSQLALQLRYLQTLSTISSEKNSTIIFPLPIELLSYAQSYNNRRRH